MGGSEELLLGRLSFVNVLPVYFFLGQHRGLFRLVSAPPSTLNRMLREALLDVSPVSSVEYAREPGSYWILRDLGISCFGKVGSVLLLSQTPMERWKEALIQCPFESETSVALLRLLLKNYWGVQATLVEEGSEWEATAFLRIGDRALKEMASGKWAEIWDLGEAWSCWTGLPFVFALWLVREEVVRHRAGRLQVLHRLLLAARDKGQQELEVCVLEAGRVLGPLNLDLREYFRGLDFHLGEEQMKGLSRFLEELLGAGLIAKKPPLRLWPSP